MAAGLFSDRAEPPDDAAGLESWCAERIRKGANVLRQDPLHNPVAAAAFALSQGLGAGAVRMETVAAAARRLGDAALAARAQRFAASHQPVRDKDRLAEARAMFDALAGDGSDAAFEAFRARIETPRAGVVFTAHPTFALSPELYAALAQRASAGSGGERKAGDAAVAAAPRLANEAITLEDEHRAVLDAVAAAQDAARALAAQALDAAEAAFGDRALALSPRLATIASWVGYDLDGRTDIRWSDALRFRLVEKARQLARYLAAAVDARRKGADVAALIERLTDALASARDDAEAFSGDLRDADAVVEAANHLTRADPRRLTRVAPLQELVEAAVSAAEDPDARRALMLLRAEMASYGLGAARIHLRVNAQHVRNAVRAALGVEGDVDRFGRVALERAAERAGETEALAINFASVHLERTTARRQLMLAAQILKHVDADAPIRFLIAECERPATVMAAIYLAKLYGIADKLDVSPLFETPQALERSGRFMAQLFEADAYRDYARARGRVCVQIGYSDSGRFMGQAAAGLAAERAQVLLARAMEAAGLKDVEALVFCTHGESMGRGAHPGGFRARLDYLITPWARARFVRAGAPLTIETSFQGGDGFLHFGTPELASASMGEVVAHALTPPETDAGDPFYADINFSWDVYRTLKDWQERLMDDADHHALLDAFAGGLLVKSGSRRAKRPRQDEPRGARALRAIPHNATLQQLAFPINVAGGVGEAAQVDPERFIEAAKASTRWRLVVDMAAAARRRLSLDVLRGYASLFDATAWTVRALKGRRAGVIDEDAAALAHALLDRPAGASIHRLVNRTAGDLARFDEILVALGADDKAAGEELERLKSLHILRLGLMAHALTLAARLPDFSPRADAARPDFLEHALHFRIPEAVDIIERVFPEAEPAAESLLAIEEPGEDIVENAGGYRDIHAQIARPLRAVHALILEIGLAIAHAYDAYG